MDWSKYPNFKKSEFDCKHTGLNRMRPEFMDIFQQIRTTYGKPMFVPSGYRDKTHPVEAAKQQPGEHFYGVAADVRVTGTDALDLIIIAYGYGIRRIGVQQKGLIRFIHIGMGDKMGLGFPPGIWSY
jgi:zinc D-Ala-D-Ala carboxypeptidase